MTTYQLIQMMANRGFYFECGPHSSCAGFYAIFVRAPSFVEHQPWEKSGHGLTLHRAIVMAMKIATGRTVHIPPRESFVINAQKAINDNT